MTLFRGDLDVAFSSSSFFIKPKKQLVKETFSSHSFVQYKTNRLIIFLQTISYG